jgi:hypothetical protein
LVASEILGAPYNTNDHRILPHLTKEAYKFPTQRPILSNMRHYVPLATIGYETKSEFPAEPLWDPSFTAKEREENAVKNLSAPLRLRALAVIFATLRDANSPIGATEHEEPKYPYSSTTSAS